MMLNWLMSLLTDDGANRWESKLGRQQRLRNLLVAEYYSWVGKVGWFRWFRKGGRRCPASFRPFFRQKLSGCSCIAAQAVNVPCKPAKTTPQLTTSSSITWQTLDLDRRHQKDIWKLRDYLHSFQQQEATTFTLLGRRFGLF